MGHVVLLCVGRHDNQQHPRTVFVGVVDGWGYVVMKLSLIIASKPVRTSLARLMISGLLFLAVCGGGSSGDGGGTGGTPAGTYTISISGSAGAVVNATKLH
jgi:hypothetical protein